jgi:hypothetical protein
MTEQPEPIRIVTPQEYIEQRAAERVQLDDSPLPATRTTTPMLERMRAEAEALQVAATISNSMSKSKTVLPQYQRAHRPKLPRNQGGGYGQPLGDQAVVNGAAAIMYGTSLGIGAIQSLKLVHTIGSSCGIEARTMQALCIRAGVRFTFDPDNNDTRAVVGAERDGHKPVSSEWTMAHAEVRGYTSNELYQSHPDEMLRAKALAECCRMIAPDVILGLDYTLEELQLEQAVVQVTAERVPRTGGVEALKSELAAAAAADSHTCTFPDPKPGWSWRCPECDTAWRSTENGWEPYLVPPPPDPEPGPVDMRGEGRLPDPPIPELPAVFAMVKDEAGPTLAAQMELVSGVLGRAVADWAELTADDCGELLLVLSVPPAPDEDTPA